MNSLFLNRECAAAGNEYPDFVTSLDDDRMFTALLEGAFEGPE
jgi:hypothetical protein